jgi:hypothetical protein
MAYLCLTAGQVCTPESFAEQRGHEAAWNPLLSGANLTCKPALVSS